MCVCVCGWFSVRGVDHSGGKRDRERERERRKKTERRCEFKRVNEGGRDSAKIGRPISAAAAACLPLTACSCEPVLGMTANGLPGTLA